MLALCKYMAELVDEDGYLTQEDLDGLTEMKIPQTMVDQALDAIQSLEPAVWVPGPVGVSGASAEPPEGQRPLRPWTLPHGSSRN